jgi:hypothetical protein
MAHQSRSDMPTTKTKAAKTKPRKAAAKRAPRKPRSPNPSADGVQYLGAEDAEALVGIAARRISAAVRSGELAGRDFGGAAGIRTTPAALDAWLTGAKPAPSTAPIGPPAPEGPPEAVQAIDALLTSCPELWGDHVTDGKIKLVVAEDAIYRALAVLRQAGLRS